MALRLKWAPRANREYEAIAKAARRAFAGRKRSKKKKSSKQEGLFRQVTKALRLLASDPRHPGLQTHEYLSIPNPYKRGEKVFAAYAQDKTPGAYRIFWCYGPERGQITIIAVTPHP